MKRSNQFGILMFIFVGVCVFCYAMNCITPYRTVIQGGEEIQVPDYSAWYYPKIQILMAGSITGVTATVFPLMYFVEKEGDFE